MNALNLILDDNNYIRLFRLLRDLKKGCTLPRWLDESIAQWVEQFLNSPHTDAIIARKASILLMKIDVLLPNPNGLPSWAYALLEFFLQQRKTGSLQTFCLDFLATLIRSKKTSTKDVIDWIEKFKGLNNLFMYPKGLNHLFLYPNESVPFLKSAIARGYTLGEASSYWKDPVLHGLLCPRGSPKFEFYLAGLTDEIKSGRLKGQINDYRVDAFARSAVAENHREEVLTLYLAAGRDQRLCVSGTVSAPVFSFTDVKRETDRKTKTDRKTERQKTDRKTERQKKDRKTEDIQKDRKTDMHIDFYL